MSKEYLNDEITTEFAKLQSLDIGTDEHVKAVESLTKLYKLKQDDERNQKEIELKEDQNQSEKLGRWVKNGIEFLGITLPLGFYYLWMNKGFEFESTGGVFTSPTFKGLTNKFKPTKR